MNLNITGRHVEVTPAIRDYLNEKLNRSANRFDSVIDINVILSVEKIIHKAEATMHLAGKDIHVEASDENMYAAIDTLADMLERQLRKHKERGEARRHDDSGKRNME